MKLEEQSGSASPNSVHMPNNQQSVASRNRLHSKEGDEHAPKVRKPYTITKQRERWTEEEHKKFLEALQLYGRAWRRIEEHIGTKTAVQIRSHAQKFFSKVVRESASNDAGNVKPIDIPPPRPKRKPSHPYPRKMGHSSSDGHLNLVQVERSSSSILSVSEQENGSPTSVLSAVGSDTMCSLPSNLPNHCISPVSSAPGSDDQESSVEEDNGPPWPGASAVLSTTQEQDIMELDLGAESHLPSKEASSVEAKVPTLKLFGRILLVTDSQKPASSCAGNLVQNQKSSPSVDAKGQDRSADMDLGPPRQPTFQGTMHGDHLLGPGRSTWHPWSREVLPMMYSLPTPYGDPMTSAEARAIPLAWWAMCGNIPLPFIHPQNLTSGQNLPQFPVEVSEGKEAQKECSWTGSNSASGSRGGSADESDKTARGFVPYKRCVVERKVQQPQRASDDLCL